jgi:hypothetical protein
MTVARVRLLIAAILFFGWLCWLGYLAFTQTNPVVLSRSQAMAADRFVVGEVTTDPATGSWSRTVTVVQDLRPVGAPLSGTIEVRNLEQADVTGGENRFRNKGHYLLMLTPIPGAGEKTFDLTRPPGRVYHPDGSKRIEPGRPWAYKWDNPDVQRQFEELVPKR